MAKPESDVLFPVPTCDDCGNTLTGLGGLLFGPPDEEGRATKHHLCVGCHARTVAHFGSSGQS